MRLLGEEACEPHTYAGPVLNGDDLDALATEVNRRGGDLDAIGDSSFGRPPGSDLDEVLPLARKWSMSC